MGHFRVSINTNTWSSLADKIKNQSPALVRAVYQPVKGKEGNVTCEGFCYWSRLVALWDRGNESTSAWVCACALAVHISHSHTRRHKIHIAHALGTWGYWRHLSSNIKFCCYPLYKRFPRTVMKLKLNILTHPVISINWTYIFSNNEAICMAKGLLIWKFLYCPVVFNKYKKKEIHVWNHCTNY